jgi:flagellar hook-basal body complex protein FliE
MPSPANFHGLNSAAIAGALPAREGTSIRSAASPEISFQDVLLQSIEQVNEIDRESQAAVAMGLTGGDLTQAEVMTSMKRADLAFRTMLQIRNKLVDAYNEVKNMRM